LNVSGSPTLIGGNGGGLTDVQTVNGTGVLNVTVNTGVLDFAGSWAGFNGKIQFTGTNFMRFDGSTGGSQIEYDLGNGGIAVVKRNSASVITLGALGGGPNATLQGASGSGNTSATTYSIGGKNLNTTFSGTIVNGQGTTSISKIGTGTQILSGANTYTGSTSVSGGGLLVNGNQSAATGPVSVSVNATLGGNGIVGGAVTVSGTIAPGSTIGRLTLNSNLTLNAGSFASFEVTRVPFTNDSLVVAGTTTLNGTLQVINGGVEALQAGDNFKLLSLGAVFGSFAALDLPPLDDGLDWSTNRLATDGRLWVVVIGSPTITAASQGTGNFVFTGNGGTPGWNYFVLSTTNLAQPMALWERLSTNTFSSTGAFAVTNSTASTAQRFFLIQVQP